MLTKNIEENRGELETMAEVDFYHRLSLNTQKSFSLEDHLLTPLAYILIKLLSVMRGQRVLLKGVITQK